MLTEHQLAINGGGLEGLEGEPKGSGRLAGLQALASSTPRKRLGHWRVPNVV